MPTLLVSLGTSAAIAPEAFFLPGVSFDTVHVLTTDSEQVDTAFVADWFAEHAPGTRLTITRVEGFTDFKSENDHFTFEEVLYRWWLGLRETLGNSPTYVCLSGGFKTMSASMQKAAAVFGAAELFHVLCDLPSTEQPKTSVEIDSARSAGHLRHIRLGPETGWPQLVTFRSEDYPLAEASGTGSVLGERKVGTPDHALRDRLREITDRGHRIASAWERIDSLPFPTLATWSGEILDWLGQSVDPESETDRGWIAILPKIELHCHLGGFASHGDLLGEVRSAAERPAALPALAEPLLPEGWPLPSRPVFLADYMKLGDATGSALLRDPGCLRRQCELLFDHLARQNVAYAEIRCSPANYADPGQGRSPWDVLSEIKQTFDRCRQSVSSGAAAPRIHLILIATRRETGDYRAAISRHLALAVTAAEHWTDAEECRVVGVDLAGFEDRQTRAHYFREEFTGIHRCGLALTVHAGENDDAEGIWRAVFDLNARRLGHALHLVDSPELMRSVADRGVGVEMCPYANYQIKGFHPMVPENAETERQHYPLKRYLDAGVRVTVNTDNIGISSATLNDNLLLAARLCPDLTRMDVLRLLQHAIESAFLPNDERNKVRSLVEATLSPP
ncbi:MAG: CRISPR-associated ring nuclease [Verrucomicrobiales bacterium]